MNGKNYKQGQEFLSRLCGGEVTKITKTMDMTFLSRLCGGEDANTLAIVLLNFLSRLCGGEVSGFSIVNNNRFSKPPMWR